MPLFISGRSKFLPFSMSDRELPRLSKSKGDVSCADAPFRLVELRQRNTISDDPIRNPSL